VASAHRQTGDCKRAPSQDDEAAEKDMFDQLVGFTSNTLSHEDHQLLDSFFQARQL
jgi:hypothetical protein